MIYYTPEEFAAELEMRGCRFLKAGPNGYKFWESHTGEPFSVPPPGEVIAGEHRYPQSLLLDIVKEVGLPPKGLKS